VSQTVYELTKVTAEENVQLADIAGWHTRAPLLKPQKLSYAPKGIVTAWPRRLRRGAFCA
jgi:hypothetical protein